MMLSKGPFRWFKNGKLHRNGDKPAVIYDDGSVNWYKNDKLHRTGNKPAMVDATGAGWDGSMAWYKNNKRYRVGDQPNWIGDKSACLMNRTNETKNCWENAGSYR